MSLTSEHLTILDKLYRAQVISRAESQRLFSAIVHGHLEPSQLAAALISMKIRGEHPDEIAGAASALLEAAQPFPARRMSLPTSSAPAAMAATALISRPPAPLSPRPAAYVSPSTATAAYPAVPDRRICCRRWGSVWT